MSKSGLIGQCFWNCSFFYFRNWPSGVIHLFIHF